MKHSRKIAMLLLTLFICAICMNGCAKEPQLLSCPFTEITWNNTFEEIKAASGELIETRDSIYDGTSYVFSKEYKGYDGSVYYIYDEKEKLVSMAWGYSTESSEQLEALYDEINADIIDEYGECDYAPKAGGANVWYTDGGNIVLYMLDTSEYKALQLNYVHPDVAEKE